MEDLSTLNQQSILNLHVSPPPAPNATNSAKNKKLFPQKLWDLINDDSYSFCLRWSDDGQLVYLNRDEFEDSYLKTAENQFHTQKAISFVRQMNMYGFRKVDDCYYENDNFKRDCEHLLKNMIRKHPNKSASHSARNHIHHDHPNHHHHHHKSLSLLYNTNHQKQHQRMHSSTVSQHQHHHKHHNQQKTPRTGRAVSILAPSIQPPQLPPPFLAAPSDHVSLDCGQQMQANNLFQASNLAAAYTSVESQLLNASINANNHKNWLNLLTLLQNILMDPIQ